MKTYLTNCIFILICLGNGILFGQNLSLEKGEEIYNSGNDYYEAKKLDSAEIQYLAALEIYQNLNPTPDTLIADCYHNLGQIYSDQKKSNQAMEFVNKGMEMRKAVLGENSLEVGLSLKSIGNIFLDIGKYDSAIFYYEKTTPILENNPKTEPNSKAILYSNLGSLYQEMAKYEQAIEKHNLALKIRKELFEEESFEVAASYNNLANTYLDMGEYDLAMDFYIRSLTIKEKVLPDDHPSLASSYNNLGSGYQLIGEEEKALKNYEKALEIRRRIFPENHPYLGRSYYNIGSSYLDLNEFQKAYQTFEKAIQIWTESLGPENIYTSMGYHGLALSLIELGKYEETVAYAEKSLEINLETFGKAHPSIIQIHQTLGDAYNRSKQFEKALAYFNEAFELQVSLYGPKHSFLAIIYQNIGNVYQDSGQLEEAINNYEKAAAIELDNFGEFHPNLAKSYQTLASLNAEIGNCSESDTYYQKSFSANIKGFSSKSPNDLPLLDQEILSPIILLEGLYQKAFSLEKCERVGEGKLEEIAATYGKTIELVDKIIEGYRSEDGLLYLKSESRGVYEGAIRTMLALYEKEEKIEYLEKALVYAEKGKATRFNQLLRATKTRNFSGLPQEIFDYEEKVRSRLTFYEKELTEAEINGEFEGNDEIKAEIFALNQSYDSLLKIVKSDYPDYYQLVYKPQVADRKSILKSLPENAGFLEYFVGKSHLYTFYIKGEKIDISQLPLPNPEKSLELRKSIYSYYTGIDSAIKTSSGASQNLLWKDLSQELYQELIANVIDDVPERLIIVPDGELGYLPFEILMDEKGEYLIEKSALSYVYSATHFTELNDRKLSLKPSKKLLAIAPTFKKQDQFFADVDVIRRSYLGPLFYSKQEVEEIQGLMGGDILEGKEATKEAFLEKASDYQILHISSHGKVNDAYPALSFIAFASESDSIITDDEPLYGVSGLYLADLYNLNLNADMVVLSACETGIGKLAKAEGIMSLARGFAFAGASSIVTTMWSVNDKTSAELMKSFYQNIEKGLPRDIALQNAKKAFIDENEPPFYWAGFVIIGDAQPIPNHRSWLIWLLFTGGLTIIISFLLIKRKSRNRA